MANKRTTSLTELTSIAAGDKLYLVDVSDITDDSSGSSKFITFANIITGVESLASGFAASGANSDITSLTGLTTPLTVAQGGTGAATLTGVVIGNGTSAFTTVTAPSGTIVGTSDTQTLTNKTLTTPLIASLYQDSIGGSNLVTMPAATTTLVGRDTTDTLTNKTLTAPKFADEGFIADANGNELIQFDTSAGAINHFRVSNGAMGNDAVLEAVGDDSNVSIVLTSKGSSSRVDIATNDLNLSQSDGNITVQAAAPNRVVSIFGGMKPTTTAGCAAKATVEAGTNDIDYDVLDFDASSDENAFVNFQMPDSWDGGVIQFRYVWTNAGGGSAETVDFALAGLALADDGAIDQAVGTPVTVTDTWLAQGDIHTSEWSGDVTIAGSPAGGQWVHFEIFRDVSEDDLTGDARLMDVQIRYKQAQFSE